ncbi:2,5-diketo-D-gluconic acid reductase [Campylobacter sp. MIT 12-5580]|nr:2,5-diketo-D-gluconic acid reductase [Campylobacter sp. MIT 12-5580]
MPFVTLNNGVKMPMVGFGTFNMKDLKEVQTSVESALEVGYRHFDTAQRYGSEEGLGAGIKASGVKREEIFITTKLLPRFANEKDTLRAFEDSLKRLQTDYVDLFLLHWPVNDTYAAWRIMSRLQKEGRIKALGVCNFTADRLVDFCINNEIKPAINQAEFHPLYQRTALQKAGEEYGVKLVSWSSFGRGREGVLDNKELARIAKKYNKSVAQVVLRWLIEQDIIVMPKTTRKERMIENISIFDFKLDESDKTAIAKLDKGKSLFYDPQDVERIKWFNSKEYDIIKL